MLKNTTKTRTKDYYNKRKQLKKLVIEAQKKQGIIINEYKNRLKEVLSIPTYSRNEELMITYLKEVLDEKGYEYYVDDIGNIYITKGNVEYYPCFVAHTDTVHRVNKNLRKRALANNINYK